MWPLLLCSLALGQDLLVADEEADFVEMDLSEPEPALDPAQQRLLALGPRYRATNLHVFTGFRTTQSKFNALTGTSRLVITDHFQPEPELEWLRADGDLKRWVEPLVRVFDSAHNLVNVEVLHGLIPAVPAWSGKHKARFDYGVELEQLRALVAAHNQVQAERLGLTPEERAQFDAITTWPDDIVY